MDPNAQPSTPAQPVSPTQLMQTAVPPIQATPQQVPPQASMPMPAALGQVEYASVSRRFGAVILDSLILNVPLIAIGALLILLVERSSEMSSTINLIQTLFSIIGYVYFVYFTYKDGATPGKKILKIKVIREDGTQLTLLGAILREVVGKFASSIVFALGYFWAIWDGKKQTWHDKIAKTVVVRV